MKKLIKVFFIFLLLFIIAVIAIPFLVPLDSYKPQIIALVKEKTGRELAIDGHIKASVFPVIGLQIGKTSLSNPKNYKSANMVQVDSLNVEVGLSALLQKQLQVKQFILVKPIVNLEVNNNKPNWNFDVSASSPEDKPDAQTTAQTKTTVGGSEALLAGLMLGDIKITDGEINYQDDKTKRVTSIKSLNLKASLPSLAKKFSMEADAIWNGQNINLKASVENPNQIIDGKKSAFTFDLKTKAITLHYAGDANQESAKGNVDLNIPSIPDLAKWTGAEFEWKGSSALAFAVRGELAGSASSVSLKNSEITLDNTKLKGDINAKIDEKIPDIDIKLSSDAINLNPFISKQPAIKTSWLIDSAIAAELSNQHIDLSSLNSVNAKLRLTLGSIIYDKIKLGKTVIDADLNNGKLKLNIPEMAMYGGGAKVNAALDSSGAFTKQLSVTNVNAGELLGDLTSNNRFTGMLNASANLNGKLTSVQGLMKSLGGNGNIKITDGIIKGIDLTNMVNNIKTSFTNSGAGDTSQQTAFSELGGTFTIVQGIVSNNDLSLKSKVLTLSGKGTINLPMQTLQYRLNPEIVSTVKRGDGSSTKGLEVPIIVQGSLENPQFKPDLEGMLQNTLDNPNALKNTVKSLKEQFKGGKGSLNDVKGLLKGFGQ